MKITVELSETDIKEIRRVTGERKKGPAIRKLVADALQMKRQELLANKFLSGEWGVELNAFEAAQEAERPADRKASRERN